jgi:hypothetical protein
MITTSATSQNWKKNIESDSWDLNMSNLNHLPHKKIIEIIYSCKFCCYLVWSPPHLHHKNKNQKLKACHTAWVLVLYSKSLCIYNLSLFSSRPIICEEWGLPIECQIALTIANGSYDWTASMFSGYKSQQIGLQALSFVGLVRQNAVFLKREICFLPSEHLHSSSAQYATLPKYFSHPSLVMYSFAIHIKLKLGLQIRGGLLIANHLDQSLSWANQKHSVPVRSYLLFSFLQVRSAAAPLISHGNLCNYVETKPFSWAKPRWVGFSSSNSTVQVHPRSAAGDALILHQNHLKQTLAICTLPVIILKNKALNIGLNYLGIVLSSCHKYWVYQNCIKSML